MKCIDLHVHSTMSDGSFSPKQIVALAKERDLAAITLTDHDTIDGLNIAAQAAQKEHIDFINGMEISVDYEDRKLHIVALGFDPEHSEFKKLYQKIRYNKENKMEKVIDIIQARGVDISLEKVKPFIKAGNLERYAIMRYLVSIKLYDNIQDIWDNYLNPAVDELGLNKNVNMVEVAAAITAAGGVTSLAHFHKLIGLKGKSRQEQEDTIAKLHKMGLDGMEKYYTNYSDDDKKFAAAMIEKYNLLSTGGSDFHGGNRVGVELGTGCKNNLQIPYTFYENIINNTVG